MHDGHDCSADQALTISEWYYIGFVMLIGGLYFVFVPLERRFPRRMKKDTEWLASLWDVSPKALDRFFTICGFAFGGVALFAAIFKQFF